jgi:hypothetical protein
MNNIGEKRDERCREPSAEPPPEPVLHFESVLIYSGFSHALINQKLLAEPTVRTVENSYSDGSTYYEVLVAVKTRKDPSTTYSSSGILDVENLRRTEDGRIQPRASEYPMTSQLCGSAEYTAGAKVKRKCPDC